MQGKDAASSRTPINHDAKRHGHLSSLGPVRSGSGHTVICTSVGQRRVLEHMCKFVGTSWGQLCQRLQQLIVRHHQRRHCCQVTSVTQRPAYFCLQHRSNSKANAQKFGHTAKILNHDGRWKSGSSRVGHASHWTIRNWAAARKAGQQQTFPVQDVAGQSVAILQVFAAMDALKMNDLSSFCIGDGHPTDWTPFNGYINFYKGGPS